MSTDADRRLTKIEQALYPTEAMALWLQETKQGHHSLRDLTLSLLDQPDEAWPLMRLTRQVEAAVRTRRRNTAAVHPRREQDSAIVGETAERGAVRDVAMLFYLFMEANGLFLQEKRALSLLVALLLHSVRDWFRDGRMPQWGEPLDRRLQLAVEELYGWQRAVAILSDRYFQGVNPLLPEVEENLAWIVAQGELLVALFNDHLEFEGIARKAGGKRKPPLPKPLDIAALKRSAERRAKALVAYLLDLARAQACDMMGEHRQALAFAERHL